MQDPYGDVRGVQMQLRKRPRMPEYGRDLIPDIKLFERNQQRTVPVQQAKVADSQGKRERIGPERAQLHTASGGLLKGGDQPGLHDSRDGKESGQRINDEQGCAGKQELLLSHLRDP